ncbi:hypothetical protein MYAM1_002008 [Malassezia yamatoensis]|uniref:Transmembrane protein 135 N-terminal domain-containing protein n=1 Tax=Malassezia yamatoensis TaxID=253288 RepID=A0AAJ5YZ82_9BASI|nr:hypothetical protein MYAM1_002008 [Malassezia yamatoensis]
MTEENEKKRPFPGRLTSLPLPPEVDEGSGNESDNELSAWQKLQSGASTPNLSETMENLKRSLSISALHEMSTKPSAEMRRNIQNKLWRPKDEEMRIPTDWERLMVYVLRVGARTFVLSYGLRGSMSMLFALIKMLRSRRKGRVSLLQQSFLAEDTIRFALMFGLWSSLFKFVNNALRLLTPLPRYMITPVPPSRTRTESDPTPQDGAGEEDDGLVMKSKSRKSGKHAKHHKQHKASTKERFRNISPSDPRIRWWHAYVSGAISSVALLVERKSLIQSFGPQLFVRGLEGSYRFARSRGYIDIPYGSILVFGIANTQIIWAWFARKDLLPKSYSRWITKASNLPSNLLDMLEGCLKTDPRGVNPWIMVDLMGGQLPEPISTNPSRYPSLPPTKAYPSGISGDTVAKIYKSFERDEPHCFPTCALSHPHTSSHLRYILGDFASRWRWIMPVYMTLYIVPAVFLRPKSFFKDPKHKSLHLMSNAARSSAFLATYVEIIKSSFCVFHSLSDWIRFNPTLNQSKTAMRISDILQDGKMNMVPGFLSCLSLFVEQPHRRSELSAYVLPKALESYWKLGRQKGFLPHIPYGDFWLASVSISLIMGTYTNHPESLSRLVSLVIYQFMGRN